MHSTQRFLSVSHTLDLQSLEAWQDGTSTQALFTQSWPLAQSVAATH